MVGLTNKYSNRHIDGKRSVSKIFPTYGISSPKDSYLTTRNVMDVPCDELNLEVTLNQKTHNRKRFDLKDYMEELLKSNIKPNRS